MKKFTLVAAFAAMAISASAQSVVSPQETALTTIQEATDVIPIFISDQVRTFFEGANRIKDDLSPNEETRFLYIWPDGSTYAAGTPSGMNSVGAAEDYMAFVVAANQTWSGLGYTANNDVSVIDDDYIFHIAMKSNDNATHALWIGAAKMSIGDTKFEDTNILENFPRDGKWYNFDIPVKVMKNFSTIASGALFEGDDLTKYTGNSLCFLSGGVAGTELNYDQAFFYKKGGSDGIQNVKAENENAAAYNLAGQKVDANFKGIVVKNGKKYMK